MVEIITGPPVTGHDFYDRQELIQDIWNRVKAGSILFVAPRRFGKTSVMLHLRDHPRPNYSPIFLDVEWLESPAQFIVEIIAEMVRNLPGFRRVLRGAAGLPKEVLRFVKDTISNIEVAEFKIGLREQIDPNWSERGKVLLKLAEQLGGTVLLIVDELPLMAKHMLRGSGRDEVERFLHWLRSLRQGPEVLANLRFIFGGSIGIAHVLRQAGADASMNDLTNIKVDPFPGHVAGEFVRDLFASQRQDVGEDTVQRVLDEVEVFVPFFLQLLVSESCKLAREGLRTVSPELVSEAYRRRVISVESRTYFESFYTRLKDYYDPLEEQAAKAILRELAVAGELPVGHLRQIHKQVTAETAAEAFSHLLGDLENDFYLELRDATCRFHTKVLRDWWLRFYGLE